MGRCDVCEGWGGVMCVCVRDGEMCDTCEGGGGV